MSDALIPLHGLLVLVLNHESELGQRLGFAMHGGKIGTYMGMAEHVQPLPAWPHIGVRPHGAQPRLLPNTTPYVQYTPADLEMLEADLEKRELYVERYTDCIVPCLLEFADMMWRKRYLLEDTGSIYGFLQMIFGAQAPTTDWPAFNATGDFMDNCECMEVLIATAHTTWCCSVSFAVLAIRIRTSLAPAAQALVEG